MWKPVIDRQMERKWMYLQVLQLIQQYGAISRVEIANKLHMTRASVTLLIHEMMEKGVLEDIGTCPTSEGKGRRKLLMDVHPSRWLLIGISIQGNHLVVGLTTLGMNTLEKQCIPFPVMQASWVSIQEQMIITVRQILKSNYIEESQILGLGVGLMPSVLQICMTVSNEEPPTPLWRALLMVDRGTPTAKANCRTLRYCREISSRTMVVRLSIIRPPLMYNNDKVISYYFQLRA